MTPGVIATPRATSVLPGAGAPASARGERPSNLPLKRGATAVEKENLSGASRIAAPRRRTRRPRARARRRDGAAAAARGVAAAPGGARDGAADAGVRVPVLASLAEKYDGSAPCSPEVMEHIQRLLAEERRRRQAAGRALKPSPKPSPLKPAPAKATAEKRGGGGAAARGQAARGGQALFLAQRDHISTCVEQLQLDTALLSAAESATPAALPEYVDRLDGLLPSGATLGRLQATIQRPLRHRLTRWAGGKGPRGVVGMMAAVSEWIKPALSHRISMFTTGSLRLRVGPSRVPPQRLCHGAVVAEEHHLAVEPVVLVQLLEVLLAPERAGAVVPAWTRTSGSAPAL